MLDMLQTESDWDALPGFLEGLKGSRRTVTRAMAEKLARRAGRAGRIGTMIDILRRTERTGVRLDHVALARQVMRGALQRAIQSGWSEAGIAWAAKKAGVIMELIEDPAHVPADNERRDWDPRCAPDVVGLAMTLTAFKVLKAGEGEGKRDMLKVEKYAKRVLDLWKNADLHVPESEGSRWWDANTKLLIWAPVAQGMRWAIRALGEQSETARRLGTVLRADVEPALRKSERVVEESAPQREERVGVIMVKEMERVVV